MRLGSSSMWATSMWATSMCRPEAPVSSAASALPSSGSFPLLASTSRVRVRRHLAMTRLPTGAFSTRRPPAS